MDLEKELGQDSEPAATVQRWPKHCIFRVPPHFKGHDGGFYKPRLVSLGPFHHGDPDLLPMREHKLRAVRHLLRRAGKPLGELVAAVEAVAEELEAAYAGLGDEWRGGAGRRRFLDTMVVDGCFLLEIMRAHDVALSGRDVEVALGYARGDPVYGKHGALHTAPFVQRDMLVLENQLPLRVLERIGAVANGSPRIEDDDINWKVLDFFSVTKAAKDHVKVFGLGLHPLDIYRKSQFGVVDTRSPPPQLLPPTRAVGRRRRAPPAAAAPIWTKCLLWFLENFLFRPRKDSDLVVHRSAQKLNEMGVQFKRKPEPCCVVDEVKFGSHGELFMPRFAVDDATEHRLQNMMAFEALHGGAGNDVTAYVLFLRHVVSNAGDVELLVEAGIIENNLAGDGELAALLGGLAKDVPKHGKSRLCSTWEDVTEYCLLRDKARVVMNREWAHLKIKYFRSPWTSIALAAAIFLLCADAVQTVCAVLSYLHDLQGDKNSSAGSLTPSPKPP